MSDRLMRELRVKLTDAERLAKAEQSARVGFELAEIEDKKALMGRQLAEQIKALKAERSRLDYDVQSGTEERPVACYERPRFKDLCIDLVRTDTGEQVQTRPMTAAERQTKLELVRTVPEADDEEPDEPSTH